jgi:AcrR family transcriptional regulator
MMRAAEDLFSRRRFHEITLDDLIRQAGVGKGTVYRYFRDKDDLFFQTAVRGFDEVCELLEGAASDSAPFTKQLLVACERISAFFRRRRPLFRMMHSEEFRVRSCKGELRSRWMIHRKRMALAMAEVLRRGVEEGVIREDIPADALASVLLGMLRTHARDLAETLGQSRSLRTIVELFLRGAAAGARRRDAIRPHRPALAASGGDRP